MNNTHTRARARKSTLRLASHEHLQHYVNPGPLPRQPEPLPLPSAPLRRAILSYVDHDSRSQNSQPSKIRSRAPYAPHAGSDAIWAWIWIVPPSLSSQSRAPLPFFPPCPPCSSPPVDPRRKLLRSLQAWLSSFGEGLQGRASGRVG